MEMNKDKTPYAFSTDIEVRDYELDAEGIVNNANYLHYLEWTRHLFCKKVGYAFAEMAQDGISPVVNHIEVDYKSPLRSGDVMESKLWVERQGARIVFHQDIFNKGTGQMAASAVVSIVTLKNGRLSRCEEFQKIFADYLKSD